MIIKIDTNKFESRSSYMKRTGDSKQSLHNKIIRGQIYKIYIEELDITLIAKDGIDVSRDSVDPSLHNGDTYIQVYRECRKRIKDLQSKCNESVRKYKALRLSYKSLKLKIKRKSK